MTAPVDTTVESAQPNRFAPGKASALEASATVNAVLSMVFLFLVGSWVWVSRIDPLPDFAVLEVNTKKQTFFAYLIPHVEAANQDIRTDRARLLEIIEQDGGLSWWQRRYLGRLAATYDLDIPFDDASQLLRELKLRVDTVPTALVVIQAAKESGWGTSRFAREGYNLFGQQCFEAGCGFVPKARKQGRKHEVARFSSAREAVDAYLHNLNTHHRYTELRKIRATSRQAGEKLSGLRLAEGLMAYSERGRVYIDEVKQMIRTNKLE